jgi:hypothetical protein
MGDSAGGPRCVVPGDCLGTTAEVVAGAGCYTAGTSVFASVLGVLAVRPVPAGKPGEATQLVEVRRRKALEGAAPVLPQIGSIVIAKVSLRKIRGGYRGSIRLRPDLNATRSAGGQYQPKKCTSPHPERGRKARERSIPGHDTIRGCPQQHNRGSANVSVFPTG